MKPREVIAHRKAQEERVKRGAELTSTRLSQILRDTAHSEFAGVIRALVDEVFDCRSDVEASHTAMMRELNKNPNPPPEDFQKLQEEITKLRFMMKDEARWLAVLTAERDNLRIQVMNLKKGLL